MSFDAFIWTRGLKREPHLSKNGRTSEFKKYVINQPFYYKQEVGRLIFYDISTIVGYSIPNLVFIHL